MGSQADPDPQPGPAPSKLAYSCCRIVRMLVIEGYLWEDMVVTRDQMATAYLRLGNRAQNLLQVLLPRHLSFRRIWI